MNTVPPMPAGPLRGADADPEYVQRRTQDGVAVLTLAGPDGNRIGPDLALALTRALATAQRDDGVRGVVLTARGPDFCAGPWTDLPPPGLEPVDAPPVIQSVAALCAKIADSPKPVVCAIHGRCISGGFAIALAAHWIVVDSRAVLHFSEPNLGRLPPGNATVRLSWRLGADATWRVLNARGAIAAIEASSLGIVDQIVDANLSGEGLVPTAIDRATALAVGAIASARPNGLSDAAQFRDEVLSLRRSLPGSLPANRHHETHLLDTIEAAQLLPPDQALAFDLVHAQDTAQAPVARALAHLARATRRALITPESKRAGHLPLRSTPAALTLSAESAARLTPGLLRSGAHAVILAPDRTQLTQVLEDVAEAQLDLVQSGHFSQTQAEEDWTRLSGRLHYETDHPPALGLADAKYFDWLENILPAGTSMMLWSPDGTGTETHRGNTRSVAMVPAPPHNPRLCEILVQDDTEAETVRQAFQLAIRMKLTPIRAARSSGLKPLIMAAKSAARRLRALSVPTVELRATGLLPSDAELGDVTDDQADLPFAPERLIVLAVINAGARLLSAGIVQRPSDIDLAMVLGAGWPNWRGGPMAEADGIGPMVLRHELQQAEGLDTDLWTADPLFDELVRRGEDFDALNAG